MNDIIFVGKHATTFTVSKHFHESWELIYCTGGEGELVFEHQILPYRAKTLALIPPRLPHFNRSKTGFTNIHINMTDVSLSLTEPVLVPVTPDLFLEPAFEAAFFHYSNGGLDQSLILPVYGQLIVTILQARMADGSRSELVRAISDQIVRNYPDADFDLNACLRSLSFNTEYLKKLFKKEMGMTPRQYLTSRRLESAANLLAISGCYSNISQVARQSGFSDPLYFSKVFKQRYGVSPKFYKPSLAEPGADYDATRVLLEQEEASSKQS